MNLVVMLKNGMYVHICSKFSVKYEASHKNIVEVDFLMLIAFKKGEFVPIGRYYI